MKYKHLILITILLLFLQGCISAYTYESVSNQQMITKHCIMNCTTFDCSVLPEEIALLKTMIANNDKDQAFQQSIVVAITNKCRTITKQVPCECATKELKRLKSMY